MQPTAMEKTQCLQQYKDFHSQRSVRAEPILELDRYWLFGADIYSGLIPTTFGLISDTFITFRFTKYAKSTFIVSTNNISFYGGGILKNQALKTPKLSKIIN